jgi:hypothetical protein
LPSSAELHDFPRSVPRVTAQDATVSTTRPTVPLQGCCDCCYLQAHRSSSFDSIFRVRCQRSATNAVKQPLHPEGSTQRTKTHLRDATPPQRASLTLRCLFLGCAPLPSSAGTCSRRVLHLQGCCPHRFPTIRDERTNLGASIHVVVSCHQGLPPHSPKSFFIFFLEGSHYFLRPFRVTTTNTTTTTTTLSRHQPQTPLEPQHRRKVSAGSPLGPLSLFLCVLVTFSF